MDPPEYNDGRFPFVLYNLGGSLMNLICSAVFFLLAMVFRGQTVIWLGFTVLAVVGAGFAVVNGVPMRMNLVSNDGMNALEMRKDKEARRAFWIQLKIAASSAMGTRLKDMPKEWFELPDPKKRGENSLVDSLPVFAANRLMDQGRLEEAEDLMEGILLSPGAMPGVYKAMLTGDVIFCELVGQGRGEKIDALMDKNQKKLMKVLKGQPSVLRTEYALALLHEKDEKKAEAAEKAFERLAAGYPYPQDIQAERALMARARERV